MSTLDDLLSQRRRAPLSNADERRVQIGVKSSRDHQLALLAGEAFDRAGAPQPGDAELVRKIVRQVEGEWSGTFQRQVPRSETRPWPRWSRWAAIPTLIAGVAAASWGGERLLQSRRAPLVETPLMAAPLMAAPLTAAPLVETPSVAAPLTAAPLTAAPLTAAPLTAAPSGEAPSVAAPFVTARDAVARDVRAARRATSLARASAPVLLRPAAPRVAVGSGQVGSGQVGGGQVVSGVSPALGEGANETARGLFLRANRLRRDDWTAAGALYEQLTRRFADSTEAGVAEMALGKHALDEGHPTQALGWFRAYQLRPKGELKSEALWGEARALESLGEAAAARAVWRRLITEYPASAYATVARQQLGS